jgi:hypothetical protein
VLSVDVEAIVCKPWREEDLISMSRMESTSRGIYRRRAARTIRRSTNLQSVQFR